MTTTKTKPLSLNGPPTQEQIDTLGELFVERNHTYTLELLASQCTTLLKAGFMIRHLRDCPRKDES